MEGGGRGGVEHTAVADELSFFDEVRLSRMAVGGELWVGGCT